MTNTLLLRVIFSIAITASVFESIILVVYTDESSMKDFVLWSVCAVGDVIGVPLASAEVGTLFFVAVDIVSIGEVQVSMKKGCLLEKETFVILSTELGSISKTEQKFQL